MLHSRQLLIRVLLRICSIFCLFLYLASCSSTLTPLNQNISVERNQGIIVFGLEWEESYIDLFSNEKIQINSNNYYSFNDSKIQDNTDSVKDGSEVDSKTNQSPPTVSEFRIAFEDKENNFFAIQYYKGIQKQHKFLAFAVEPQNFSTGIIRYTARLLNLGKDKNERFHETPVQYHLPKIDYEVESGKIIYGGTFKFYFETKKEWFGFIPKEQVNKEINLVGLKITDQFDQMKEYFTNNFSWFPVGEIKNKSIEKNYKRDFLKWLEVDADEIGNQPRDKTKYFF